MSKKRLYVLLIAACFIGYAWISITYNRINSTGDEPGICLFKRITHVPCPSCGSTRSVLSLLHGDISGALYWNPIGLILLAILVISPIWVLYDVVCQKETLFIWFIKTENFLKRKWIAILLITIVVLNWIWNIYKGL